MDSWVGDNNATYKSTGRGEGVDTGGEQGEGQAKEQEQMTCGHGQWGGALTVGVGGTGQDEQWGKG